MATFIEQLAEHIKKALKKGYTLDAIKVSLMRQGYKRISIEKATELANKILAEELPPMKEKPEILYKIEPEIKEKNLFQKLFDWLFSR